VAKFVLILARIINHDSLIVRPIDTDRKAFIAQAIDNWHYTSETFIVEATAC
jgi:hypothetical protein